MLTLLSFGQSVLLRVQHFAQFLETLKDLAKSLIMLFLCGAVNGNINIMHTTPVRPASFSNIGCWKCSGADEMPSGKRWKQYRPKGLINIIRSDEAGSSGICQNPELASSLEKNFTTASFVRV